ncbi:serine/threonine protein phosphatase 2A 57 kDa regulatory subunit B' iota isoform-like [Ananas comosus]|uniref:Serine/threonine protein phosphatase 2A regulatory subunit n=1 Tax=Ananas comosus TaxID=4615 RepID=A0A6P5FUZ3_ANACO|nr:serine/threonine protein phosphatase 2A 57 kDa regulatory subunit B' iota isoform-like [Ananas comosus]XP_020097303.1 serine/threonine protein phosphatase 2A 57 kDa regulatory subunit B' iota isoform-like [Ananas comosus]
MWKQILGKLPRKSSKSEIAPNSPPPNPGNNNSSCWNPIQQTANGNGHAGKAVIGVEPHTPFKDVSNTEKQALFINKLDLCCVVLDFSDRNKDDAEKDAKRQALIELFEYLSTENPQFTEPMIAAICRMFAANLFRVFPPNCRSIVSGGGEGEEDEPVFDPAWYHLQVIYDLLLRFVTSSSVDVKIAKKYVDSLFILRFLELFDSEDPRERDSAKTILHRIYGKFMVHRHFIRKAVSNIFYRFVFETERHNGIAELLEVFGSVISGFAQPLKEEHKIFLVKALIPLHKPKKVGVYLPQLTYCITQFIAKEPKLSSNVIRGLLKYWPVTNSQKEMMFLGELEEVLEATNMVEFQKCMVPLFRRISHCLNSSHFQVAERALFLCNNEHLINLISQNRQVILPLIYPALERNTRWHWNQSVLNVTKNVRKMFIEMDESLLLACQSNFQEEEEKRAASEERRRRIWERLESTAAFQPVTGDAGFIVPPMTAPLVAPTST